MQGCTYKSIDGDGRLSFYSDTFLPSPDSDILKSAAVRMIIDQVLKLVDDRRRCKVEVSVSREEKRI
jgi:hypothetical protein